MNLCYLYILPYYYASGRAEAEDGGYRLLVRGSPEANAEPQNVHAR